MKSKKLEDMSEKQKSNSSPTWVVANSVQLGKKYKLSK